MTISETIAQRVEGLDAPQQKALLTFLKTMESARAVKPRAGRKGRSRKAEVSAALRGIAGMWKDRTDLPKDPVAAVKTLRGRMSSRGRHA